MIHANFDHAHKILCLGAHSDDIEIGCGGTILKLLNANPDISIHWVVFSAIGERKDEALTAANSFLKNAGANKIELHNFPDTRFPYSEANEIKECFSKLASNVNPDLVFTHRKDDAHQDHRLIADLTWQHFRNHLIFEYEIPKYEGDLGQPNLFVSIDETWVKEKIDILMNAFISQQDKYWFTPDNFEALMRIRGLECHSESGFAEAFYCSKMRL
ncbi:MAG: PIG-L deacetylase family protein [Pseudomonadota bacterium]